MTDENRSIGILGGTFDPVHNGHTAIAKSFLNSGYINRLNIFLTPDPPHKSKRQFVSYSQRLKMLHAAFDPIDDTEVSDLELRLPRPSYTVNTLSYLVEKNPNNSFFLCLGKDSFIDLKKWHQWEKIVTLCELLVAERPNARRVSVSDDLLDVAHFVEHIPVDISSTQIRQHIQRNEPIADFVPPNVLNIIKEENPYEN